MKTLFNLLLVVSLFIISCGESVTTTDNNHQAEPQENNVCVEGDCGGHGVCYIENTKPICVCDEGYVFFKGYCVEHKEPSTCDNIQCDEGSYCVDLGSTYTCECKVGYHSDDNNVCVKNATCLDTTCDVNKHCIVVDYENTKCVCDNSYVEHDGECISVNNDPCVNNPCIEDNTICSRIDEYRYNCDCAQGYEKDLNNNCVEICEPYINEWSPDRIGNIVSIKYIHNIICSERYTVVKEFDISNSDNVFISDQISINIYTSTSNITDQQYLDTYILVTLDGIPEPIRVQSDYPGNINFHFDNPDNRPIVKIEWYIINIVNRPVSFSLGICLVD